MAEPIIGERVRALRRPAALTQNDLAAAADVSVDVIRKLEQGRRQTASIPTLACIAHVLGVTLAELLAGRGEASGAGEGQGLVLAIRDALTGVDDSRRSASCWLTSKLMKPACIARCAVATSRRGRTSGVSWASRSGRVARSCATAVSQPSSPPWAKSWRLNAAVAASMASTSAAPRWRVPVGSAWGAGR